MRRRPPTPTSRSTPTPAAAPRPSPPSPLPSSYARLFQAMERQNFHVPLLGGGLDKASANRQYVSGCGSNCPVFGADSATPVLEYLDHQNTPAISQYLNAVHTYYPGQFGALDAY